MVLRVAICLSLAVALNAQTVAVHHRSKADEALIQQMRAQITELQQQNQILQDAVSSVSSSAFRPITVGQHTFNTEEEFVGYYNGVADKCAVPQMPVVLTQPVVSYTPAPVIIEHDRTIQSIPQRQTQTSINCTSSTYYGTTYTNCN